MKTIIQTLSLILVLAEPSMSAAHGGHGLDAHHMHLIEAAVLVAIVSFGAYMYSKRKAEKKRK